MVRQSAQEEAAAAARTAGLVDETRLGQWMDQQGLPGAGEEVTTRFISGGASNEIFEIDRGDFTASSGARRGSSPEAGTRPCCGSSGSSQR